MDLGDPQVLINDALRGRNAALITAKGQGSERKSEKRRKSRRPGTNHRSKKMLKTPDLGKSIF